MSSQTTLADDDLFGEAAEEMRSEVEEHLDAARASVPDADAVWNTEAQNVLGVLNGLKSALGVGDAEDHLRQAKKTFIVGRRADAFDDPDDLEAQIESVRELLENVAEAGELVGELTSVMPQLRGQLQEAAETEDEDEAEEAAADEGDTEEAESEAEDEEEEEDEE
jgi:hypothetical protein